MSYLLLTVAFGLFLVLSGFSSRRYVRHLRNRRNRAAAFTSATQLHMQLAEQQAAQRIGTATAQINMLPTSEYVESEECGECAVCLCEFEAGDIMKTLPCEHKFHQERTSV